MKRESLITSIIFALFSMVFFTVGFVMGDINRRGAEAPGDYTEVGGNIDIEYYLEVSEDSIWVENYNSHRVYGGKYSDLDSLILIDNLQTMLYEDANDMFMLYSISPELTCTCDEVHECQQCYEERKQED